MSDNGEEEQKTYSGQFTGKGHGVYIIIECLRGNTAPIITANLYEVKYAHMMQWTIAQWLDGSNDFREGDQWKTMHTLVAPLPLDNASIAIVSTLIDEDRWMMVWEMEGHQVSMFGGAYGDARMPNWPHWQRIPLPGIPTTGLRRDKGGRSSGILKTMVMASIEKIWYRYYRHFCCQVVVPIFWKWLIEFDRLSILEKKLIETKIARKKSIIDNSKKNGTII